MINCQGLLSINELSIIFSLTVDCEPRMFLGENGDTCQKCPIGTKPKKYAVNLTCLPNKIQIILS